MATPSAFRLAAALLVLAAAFPARAWDELGPLAEARRTHPAFFAKGAVHQTEVDGEVYWVFTGDSDQRDGFASLSDTERYAEATLDARRNLLRHVTGGARNVTAEVSGIVVAYRFAEGPARRVVCLVPVEKVRVVSASAPPTAPVAQSAEPAPPIAAEPLVPPPAAESPFSAEPFPTPSDAVSHSAGTDLPRFSPPTLPVPVIP